MSGVFGEDAPDRFEPSLPERYAGAFDALARLFRHTVEGIERIPAQGPALLVLNHGPLPIDAVLLCHAVRSAQGRWPRFLGERMLFERPLLGRPLERWGALEGTPYLARRRLNAGDLVGVFPGGAREAWKPRGMRRTLLWDGRDGFARVAFKAGVPIVPVACPAADDLVWVLNDAMKWGARVFGPERRLPLPLLLGLGPLPFPVQLHHSVGTSIMPERRAGESSDAAVTRIKAEVEAALAALLRA